MHRVTNRRPSATEVPEHPLLDLRLNRQACKRVIAEAGLPEPRKSACFFCPFTRPSDWARMRRDRPDLFRSAASLEAKLIAKSISLGRNPVYLTRFGVPLDDAIDDRQKDLDFEPEGSCDDGYCMT